MKNIKKVIMTLALGAALSSVFSCSEIVSAREVIYVSWEEMYGAKDEFWSSEEVGYRLNVLDAAMGSRFYSLSKTSDAGEEWTEINSNPFNGRIGVAEGISFINEELGFLSLSHGAGSYGELYRTEDGGKSFEQVTGFEDVQVQLGEDYSYNPFILPGVPYEKDGSLYVRVGQGQMGDYNGRCKALFKSEDNGLTWKYEKEVFIELEG